MAWRFMLVAPSRRPGVVLSLPPIRTTPSIGWDRSNSWASMASRLRYIIVVGLTKFSDSEMAGSSMGKPPASRIPLFTSSTLCRKWAWQGFMSDHVLRRAMQGRPCQSSGA